MNYHQGDIILMRRNRPIPVTAKKIRDEIVAVGEVTGHSHRIKNAEIFIADNEPFEMVKVREANSMFHDEHPQTEIIEVGEYDRMRQYEYFPEGDIEVKD